MYKILIVEDDLDMQRLLVDYLKKSGMEAVATDSPKEALEMLKSKQNFHLAVLDIMLPEMDGLELCKKMREISDLPIIMSSARGDIGSKILGFERGADDYLAKSNQVLRCGELEVDSNKRKVTLDGYSIDLTPAEFEILNLLISNKGKPYSRESLSQAISSIAPDSSLRSIDTHIRNLRAKLGDDAKEPKYIQSVWGIGYKFCD